MFKQYPYQLYVQTQADSTQNTTGDFVAEETSWTLLSSCRDEANSGGQVVQLIDSSTVKFESLIQLPKSCPVITVGTPIKVMDGSVQRVTGMTLRFSRDQLHCRLWV